MSSHSRTIKNESNNVKLMKSNDHSIRVRKHSGDECRQEAYGYLQHAVDTIVEANRVQDVKVHREADCGSENCLVLAKIQSKIEGTEYNPDNSENKSTQKLYSWRLEQTLIEEHRSTNEVIRVGMNMERHIDKEIGKRQLAWFGHVTKMTKNRRLRKIWKWIPMERRKRGRTRRSWRSDMM
ncbi:hypothetical protein ILUMI_06120 [Ignelater luminosus]|uniref:Uncharacterized protein n=1 Tax=Ignelater luminosus TaxID=2038154 RepID=A0A8K0D950_IGNLU|nr:hypothetical protein ILUMI_06120 [Ignelater luminosus]